MKKALLLVVIFACICCLALLMTELPLFGPGGRVVEEVPYKMQSGARPPQGGMCANIGEEVPENPFRGWPTTHYVGDWRTITSWWIDPAYFRGYTHWGIDFGSWVDTRGGRFTANLAPVVSTAVYAVVVAASADGGHNHGMGNHVILNHVTCEEVCGSLDDPLEEKWWHFLLREEAPECAPEPLPTPDNPVTPTPKPQKPADRLLLCEESGWKASYFHLSNVAVGYGKLVEDGDVLGWIGNTGNSTGPHLHYQINCPEGGGAIDPAPAMCDSYANDLRGISQWHQSLCAKVSSPEGLKSPPADPDPGVFIQPQESSAEEGAP